MIREKDKLEINLSEGCYFDFDIIGGKCEITVKNALLDKKYSEGSNPIIPDGFKYFLGDVNTGFVIKDMETDLMFTWININEIVPTGYLYGGDSAIREPFGRRFAKNDISEFRDGEPLKNELLQQYISIKKYGGFYVSSHLLEYSEKMCGNLSYEKAQSSSKIINREKVSSHLLYGAEYDTMYEWVKYRAADPFDYEWDNSNVREIRRRTIFFRNLNEWTQEESSSSSLFKVVRKGKKREKISKTVSLCENACRIALLIK